MGDIMGWAGLQISRALWGYGQTWQGVWQGAGSAERRLLLAVEISPGSNPIPLRGLEISPGTRVEVTAPLPPSCPPWGAKC
jgi:hypothetical protein